MSPNNGTLWRALLKQKVPKGASEGSKALSLGSTRHVAIWNLTYWVQYGTLQSHSTTYL